MPDNTVDLWNVSERVCFANGNTQQRQERWELGGPYGPGGISEIDWRPWVNSDPVTLTFPEVGEYTITLAIENYCGVDEQSITIVVREPLAADVSGPVEACEGERLEFTATAADADFFEWDFTAPMSTGTRLKRANDLDLQHPRGIRPDGGCGLDNQSSPARRKSFTTSW